MNKPIIIPESEKLPGSFKVTIKVRSENTNDVMSVVEETLPPKALIPPHIHQNDVWVYVQSGELGALVGEEIVNAKKGQWVLKPRNVQHSMWNPSRKPTKVIEVLTPGGTEKWFEEITNLKKGDGAGFEKACKKYGIEFIQESPWIKQLQEKFDLE